MTSDADRHENLAGSQEPAFTGWICPVCGWGGLTEPSYDLGHGSLGDCPCCSMDFQPEGLYMARQGPSYVEGSRARWLAKGGRWFSSLRPAPECWDRDAQLASAPDRSVLEAWFSLAIWSVYPPRDLETEDGSGLVILDVESVPAEVVVDAIRGVEVESAQSDIRIRLVATGYTLASLETRLAREVPEWQGLRYELQRARPDPGRRMADESIWANQAQVIGSRVAKACIAVGYAFDFSPESLEEADRLYEDRQVHVLDSRWAYVDVGTELALYVGEVIRGAAGGTWVGPRNPLYADLDLRVELPDGSRIWPRLRNCQRLKSRPQRATPSLLKTEPTEKLSLGEAHLRLAKPFFNPARKLYSAAGYGRALGVAPVDSGPIWVMDLSRRT